MSVALAVHQPLTHTPPPMLITDFCWGLQHEVDPYMLVPYRIGEALLLLLLHDRCALHQT